MTEQKMKTYLHVNNYEIELQIYDLKLQMNVYDCTYQGYLPFRWRYL